MPKMSATSENKQNIAVAVRVRPMNDIERRSNSVSLISVNQDAKSVTAKPHSGNRTFSFDKVFPAECNQVTVYNEIVRPTVEEVLAGYNCTVFAYGQTGTGKTYTMEGERTNSSNISWQEDPLAGIVPRSLHHLFAELTNQESEFSVRVSFIELYNEELFDLLGSVEDCQRLRLYEDPNKKGSVVIQGLEEVVVNTREEVYSILARGAKKRQTAATMLNAHSSRSHSVFSITVHMRENSTNGEELLKIGKLNLVDLAGSENIGRSGAVDRRAREAGNINQSLLTLGRVITALVDKGPHVPYRESKLTRLLQDSLGGKTKTSIIATISPASISIEETLSTLDYAHRAKNILNRPEINQRMSRKALIRQYTEEIERLQRDLLAARDKNGFFIAEQNYSSMQERLQKQEQEIGTLAERLEYIETEKDKFVQLFDSSKQRISLIRGRLSRTFDKLTHARTSLNNKSVEVQEKAFVLAEYNRKRNELFQQASELVAMTNQAADELNIMHEKNDCWKSLSGRNKIAVDQLSNYHHKVITDLHNDRACLVSNQFNAFLNTESNLEQFCSSSTDIVASELQRSDEMIESIKSQLVPQTKHLQDQKEQLQQWMDQMTILCVKGQNFTIDQIETFENDSEKTCRKMDSSSKLTSEMIDCLKKFMGDQQIAIENKVKTESQKEQKALDVACEQLNRYIEKQKQAAAKQKVLFDSLQLDLNQLSTSLEPVINEKLIDTLRRTKSNLASLSENCRQKDLDDVAMCDDLSILTHASEAWMHLENEIMDLVCSADKNNTRLLSDLSGEINEGRKLKGSRDKQLASMHESLKDGVGSKTNDVIEELQQKVTSFSDSCETQSQILQDTVETIETNHASVSSGYNSLITTLNSHKESLNADLINFRKLLDHFDSTQCGSVNDLDEKMTNFVRDSFEDNLSDTGSTPMKKSTKFNGNLSPGDSEERLREHFRENVEPEPFCASFMNESLNDSILIEDDKENECQVNDKTPTGIQDSKQNNEKLVLISSVN